MQGIDTLAQMNPSPFNRTCMVLGSFAGIALVGDLFLTLHTGGNYQFARHTLGFVIIAFSSVWYVRLYRRALSHMIEATRKLAKEYSPENWSQQEIDRLIAGLPYEKFAWAYSFCGYHQLLRTIKKELAKSMKRLSNPSSI